MAALAALVLCAQTAPAGLFSPPDPEWTQVWYQPQVMASVDDAMKTLVQLRRFYVRGPYSTSAIVDLQVTPKEARILSESNWSESGYQWVPNDTYGFLGGQYYSFSGGASRPYSVQHSEQGTLTITYGNITELMLFYVSNLPEGQYPWRFILWVGNNGDAFSTGDRETVKKLLDAFQTLRVASWPDTNLIVPDYGFDYLKGEKATKAFKHLDWSRQGGIVITEPALGSPAAAAGLKKDDIIYELTTPDGTACPATVDAGHLSFNWPVVQSLGDKPQETFGLKVFRDGKDMSLSIALPNPNITLKQFRANRAKAAQPVIAAAPPSPPVRLGVSARELNEVESARVDGSGGVFVAAVDAGSLAEQMGFKTGDILLELNGTKLSDMASMGAVLAAGKVTTAKVLRKGTVLTLSGVTKF
jgi:hypothetical protein